MKKHALVVTVANQKGGVGKTTSTLNLAAAWVRENKKVLVIDSDPQGNLSSYLGIKPGQPPHESVHTLDEIYLSKRPQSEADLSRWIVPTEEGVDCVPSDEHLSGVEYYLFSRSDRELVLRHFIDPIRSRYDLILIDTPPSQNLLSINALTASDQVLIPMQAEFFSLEGVVKMNALIETVKQRHNEHLVLGGLFLTQTNQRRNLTQEVRTALKSAFPELLLETSIAESSALAESTGHAKSIFTYDPKSKSAAEYKALAREWGIKNGFLEELNDEQAR